MSIVFRFLSLVGFFLLFGGCGRKQRNIFSFKKEAAIKVNALDFPVVHGICVVPTNQGNKIVWRPINQSDLQSGLLVGYNIYRLTYHGFIPKNPLNHIPLDNNEFLDRQKYRGKTYFAYLVHAVFKVNEKCIQGPASQIVWSNYKKKLPPT